MKKYATIILSLVTLGIVNTPVLAQTKTAGTLPAAVRFAKAGETWGQIVADRKALAKAITEKRLADVHDLAFSLRDGVVTLPYKSGDLTAAKKAALQKQVALLAECVEQLHVSADAKDSLKTVAAFARLTKTVDAIAVLYPANALPSGEVRPLSAADKALFLIPGGVYTKADIKANGNTSPYVKFAGYIPSHDALVKSGEPVCPISETRPDPALRWMVRGKEYTFCCPPCIAEFVQKAKKTPGAIKSPEAYRKP
ncbi:MAG: hypothetical protein H8F28_26435 [Fibrella sp.]|nr:hypothetical protein [Armatimonadota bacterium]